MPFFWSPLKSTILFYYCLLERFSLQPCRLTTSPFKLTILFRLHLFEILFCTHLVDTSLLWLRGLTVSLWSFMAQPPACIGQYEDPHELPYYLHTKFLSVFWSLMIRLLFTIAIHNIGPTTFNSSWISSHVHT